MNNRVTKAAVVEAYRVCGLSACSGQVDHATAVCPLMALFIAEVGGQRNTIDDCFKWADAKFGGSYRKGFVHAVDTKKPKVDTHRKSSRYAAGYQDGRLVRQMLRIGEGRKQ